MFPLHTHLRSGPSAQGEAWRPGGEGRGFGDSGPRNPTGQRRKGLGTEDRGKGKEPRQVLTVASWGHTGTDRGGRCTRRVREGCGSLGQKGQGSGTDVGSAGAPGGGGEAEEENVLAQRPKGVVAWEKTTL